MWFTEVEVSSLQTLNLILHENLFYSTLTDKYYLELHEYNLTISFTENLCYYTSNLLVYPTLCRTLLKSMAEFACILKALPVWQYYWVFPSAD